MTVSRRLRFEVLRRDNHACRYCGATAPDVKLNIDHVIPVALGGRDEPENLVTACEPCNSGKASITPDAPIVADVAEDAVRWKRAMELASRAMDAQQVEQNKFADDWRDIWEQYTFTSMGYTAALPPNWRQAVWGLYSSGMSFLELGECIDIAMSKQGIQRDDRFRYFMGVANNRLAFQQDVARALIDQGKV